MKSTFTALALSLALVAGTCSAQHSTASAAQTPPAAHPTHSDTSRSASSQSNATPAAPKLQADMRTLWRGHIDKTRAYAMAVKAGNQRDADAAGNDVVTNAKAISTAVAGFYGDAGGAEMLRLLGGHWGAVKAMTDAEKKGDQAGVRKGLDDGIANAGEIANFLASANPNLPQDTVNGLMVAHVEHHRQQIGQIMAGDTAGEARTRAAMQEHMDTISDALAAAIAKQFPDKAA